jgi:predicted metal-dependent phosphoesterase TrpH
LKSILKDICIKKRIKYYCDLIDEGTEFTLNADLHIHTIESDGCLTSEEVLMKASQQGINLIAITDHETTSGVKKQIRLHFPMDRDYCRSRIIHISKKKNSSSWLLQGYRNDQLQERLRQIRKKEQRSPNHG